MTKYKKNFQEKYLTIGRWIAYYRKKAGLTQEELAEKVGCTPVYLGLIERPRPYKKGGMSLNIILNIAEVLNIPEEKFFNFEVDPDSID